MEIDWFEKLVGFKETSYQETKEKLKVQDNKLHSLVNGKSYEIGEFELLSLKALRERVKPYKNKKYQRDINKIKIVKGDVQEFLRSENNNYSLFQVASQFNMLEMMNPSITPEDGITRYQYDKTQGPACAIAAGAATIYRNYFVPNGDLVGQNSTKQLNGLKKIGEYLSNVLKVPVSKLWKVQNGYVLFTNEGISKINEHLKFLDDSQIDAIKSKLLIGLHHDVEITKYDNPNKIIVSQAFCSAIPISYNPVGDTFWEPFSCLILEAAYEATLLAGVLNAQEKGSNTIFLTLLGGGAFGNKEEWIIPSIEEALKKVSNFDLDIRIVIYDEPSERLINFINNGRCGEI